LRLLHIYLGFLMLILVGKEDSPIFLTNGSF
jgi:hypothetical protein